MKSCKLCWLISLILVLALGAMSYLLVIRGDVIPSNDGRTAILLKGAERDFVLAEMREFLESIEEITGALGEGDMATVIAAAKKVGSAAAGNVPLTLMSKLPIEFKTLGLDTHRAFDELAIVATDIGDTSAVLTKLSDIIGNCTTCHSGYRLGVETSE